MVPSFYIPLNYVSMALSLLALIALAVLVSALGKVGFRSYVVGIVAFISIYYVTDIVMTPYFLECLKALEMRLMNTCSIFVLSIQSMSCLMSVLKLKTIFSL